MPGPIDEAPHHIEGNLGDLAASGADRVVLRPVGKPVTGITALAHDGLVGQREQDPVQVERSICGHPAATVSIYPIIPKEGDSRTTSVDAALPLSPMSAQQSRSHRQIRHLRHKLTRAPRATAKLARRPVIGRSA